MEKFLNILVTNRNYQRFELKTDHNFKTMTVYESKSGVFVIDCQKGSPKTQVVQGLSIGDHVIFVCNLKSSPAALRELKQSPKRTEVFLHNEITYNPMSHNKVPKYHKVDPITIDEKPENLRYILHTDIVSRFMGFQIGDILQVTPKDGSKPFLRVVQ